MYVAVTYFHVRAGLISQAMEARETLVEALAQRRQGFLSCELLVSPYDPSYFIEITRWLSSDAYWQSWEDPVAWPLYKRLELLLEEDLTPIPHDQVAVCQAQLD